MERQLATIRKIDNVESIENADLIEVVTVGGWKVVTKKDEFKIGDLCVYIEIDSVLFNCETFAFLEKYKYRIKTLRLRGQISQGICFPLDILKQFGYPKIEDDFYVIVKSMNEQTDRHFYIVEDADVTDLIGVKKYEIPIPACLAGKIRGGFPGQVPKTDENRIQNLSREFSKWKEQNIEWTITEKVDGCLDENTKIETENGIKTIKEICDLKYKGKIKQFDLNKNKIVWDKIKNHFIQNNNNDWYEIELDDGNKLILTGNHQIWIPELMCWRRVDKLEGTEEFLIN